MRRLVPLVSLIWYVRVERAWGRYPTPPGIPTVLDVTPTAITMRTP